MSIGEEQLLLGGERLAGQQEWENAGTMVRELKQLDFNTKKEGTNIF